MVPGCMVLGLGGPRRMKAVTLVVSLYDITVICLKIGSVETPAGIPHTLPQAPA